MSQVRVHVVVAADKPPYRVPLMAELADVPKNGYKVASTFSGCGGSCLGFRMAGYEIVYANEFIPAAQETYRANFPETALDTRNIREVRPEEILEMAGLERGELDVLEGSPPCDPFSMAGKRQKGWATVKTYSSTKQRTDDLTFEYARLLGGLQPRVFVMENVSGLIRGKAKGYFKEILRALKASGYAVRVRLLDAQWLGVPQTRQRVIFVGIRNDLVEKHGVEPVFPDPLPYRYSVRDALPHIGRVRYGGSPDNWKDAGTHPSPTVAQSDHSRGESAYLSGGGFVEEGSEPLGNGEITRISTNESYEEKWVEADRPSPTVTAAGGSEKGGMVEERVPVRVVHDTSGEWSQGDVTDRPAPAITVGKDSMNSGHFRVEEEVRIVSDETAQGKVNKSVDEPAPALMAHGMGNRFMGQIGLEGAVEGDISDHKIAEEWDKIKPGESSKKYFNLTKPHPDAPSPTVTHMGGELGMASVVHPYERRKFTIAELRRISSFPDDFKFTGNYKQNWERMGNCVPPVMMRHVAGSVGTGILDKIAASE